jgi:hypothetical protein
MRKDKINPKRFRAIAAVAIAKKTATKKAKPAPVYDPKKRQPKEKDIEKKVRAYALKKGCLCYKFSSPAHASVPDRIIVTPRGVVGFLEMKRPGNKPTPKQDHELRTLNEHGCHATWADSYEAGVKFIDTLLMAEAAETAAALDPMDELF